MKYRLLPLSVLGAILLISQPLLSQQVKLAKVALGMDEAEVRAALAPTSPHYIEPSAQGPTLRFLIAETADESLGFTFINGRIAAFSLVHTLASGQLPFLPAGQEPTVKVLRDLITRQTWKPATFHQGDTFWASDGSGAPADDSRTCRPASGKTWIPFGILSDARQETTAALEKPAMILYPANCGVSIHLNEAPAKSENDRVTSVRIQVLDAKVWNEFVTTYQK